MENGLRFVTLRRIPAQDGWWQPKLPAHRLVGPKGPIVKGPDEGCQLTPAVLHRMTSTAQQSKDLQNDCTQPVLATKWISYHI